MASSKGIRSSTDLTQSCPSSTTSGRVLVVDQASQLRNDNRSHLHSDGGDPGGLGSVSDSDPHRTKAHTHAAMVDVRWRLLGDEWARCCGSTHRPQEYDLEIS